ncbi:MULTISPECIES: tyrosine-protein phosphatase [Streptomyces]|uniref:tyrosine-protein phosphatase n=1 Tax=Streptomyces TaxID=1883 RepID=UPI0004BDDCE7|nr:MULTISPECIES: tyrosine-protein phosphatase [Streptomyces]KOU15775.1 protein tyrosine phosphatase [Streptomyces sp. WM6349]KOU83486.1 protein tyrosine phosphatase [Streptomyces sp. XY593]KOU95482.1 protein tyrosine phosphatase [Streptomyces sp. XY511]KOV07454.1 protein tyrosine phosphatase [Streptomyces sp. XY533]KOV42444.1 protein tyrosine phosphatase [Streptomyces sp. H036]
MSRVRIRRAAAAAVAALALATLPSAAHAAAAPAAGAGARHPHQQQDETIRQIVLQGAVNVRDLGGHRTWTGGQVRQGLVYRSDALSKLTDTDVTTVSGLGLTKVIDFRIPMEVQYDGADRLPAGLSPTARPVSDLGLYGTLVGAIGSGDPVKQEQMLGGGRAEAYMRDIYRTFVTSPENRAQFAATLREIADGRQGPVLYHCTSGKDRTGWMSYVLLRALAVPEDTAERDYLASNTFRAAYDAKVRAGLKQSGRMQNPDLLIPLQEVRQDYLDSATAQLEADYGSFYGYLTQGLGLDLRTLAKLQTKLVR